MSEPAIAWIDSKIVRTDAFSLPITRKYDYIDTPITFVEHSHDEPAYYGVHAKELYKGVKNAYFKYAGVGIDFAKPLFALGRLSHEKKMIDGQMISPYELTLHSIPQPPKYPNEIQTIIDDGLTSDSGCMVAEAIGLKNGKETKVEVHVFAPGLVDSFKKAQMTAEAYITGQSGFLYTKLFIDNMIKTKGLISSDMLSDNEIDIYMNNAKKFEITTKIKIS
jgi:saccharopine dehydrogenase-like NADP-dependent oxidoreductase